MSSRYRPLRYDAEPASIPQIVAHIQKQLTEENPDYKPLRQWMQPSSIPQIVAHIQKYLTDNPITSSEEIGDLIAEYITDHPEIIKTPVMTGATANTDGESGIVPKPVAGDQTKVLFGDGTFKDIPTPEPPDVMTGATANTDGESGLVPQPQAGDQTKALFGDGTFKDIPTPEPPDVMTGATASTDGESGLVPQPMAGDQTKALFGDGTYKTPYTLPAATDSTLGGVKSGNGLWMYSDDTINVFDMTGATSSADGRKGLPPQPQAGDEDKYLKGNGTWDTPPTTTVDNALDSLSTNPVQNGVITDALSEKVSMTDINLSIPLSSWSQSGQSWPDGGHPLGTSSTSTCYKVALTTMADGTTPILCQDGDDFKVNEYSRARCVVPVWVYVGNNTVYVATTELPTGDITIRGLIIHK